MAIKKALVIYSGSIEELREGDSLGAGGDVTGPSASTDNAIARFDGTTGKLIQDSSVTVDNDGNMIGVTIDSFGNLVGADHIHYKIKANETITKGNVLKFAGYNAGENAVEVVKISSASDVAIGISHDNLSTGEFGLAVVQGITEGFNTSEFTAGTILYPNTSGGLTATAPTSGIYQACAFVLRSQSENGALLVSFISPDYVTSSANTANTVVLRNSSGNFSAGTITAELNGNAATVTNGLYTTDLGVTIQSYDADLAAIAGLTSTTGLLRKTAANTWSLDTTAYTTNTGTVTSVSASAGTGISVSGSPITSSGTLTITNTAPDQTVSLTAGTGINTSGTYPNFTITNSSPDQTVALTGSGTTSISGTYPNFTITSNDQYSGTVTSITAGTGLTGGTITGSGTIAIDSTVATLSGSQTLTNKTLTSPTMIGTLIENVFTITDGAGFAIDPDNGSIQLVTLGANRTPTVANFDAGEAVTLMINDGTAYTMTWTTIGVVWVGGTAPTLATSGYTVIELWRVGSTYYGALVGNVA